MIFQDTRELVECGAGGHNVVNHDERFSFKIECAFKGATNIFLALLPGQAGLRRIVQRVAVAGNDQWQVELSRQRASNFQCLRLGARGTARIMSAGAIRDAVASMASPRKAATARR